MDGPYSVRSPAGRVPVAGDRMRDTVPAPFIVGKYSPRAEPNRSAAARACAHEARVAGLLSRARSTTSTSVSCRIRCCRSGGTAIAMTGTTSDSCFTAPGGGVHGTFGEGEAPAAPLTRGGVPHPATTDTRTTEIAWRYLVVCGIIPNTLSTLFVLISNAGSVRRLVALHLVAIRTDLGGQ